MIMYCKYCGKQVSDQVKFCPYCGRSLTDSNEIGTEESHKPINERPFEGEKIENQAKLGKKKKGKKLSAKTKYVIIGIVFALIICWGITAYNNRATRNTHHFDTHPSDAYHFGKLTPTRYTEVYV